LGCAGEVVEVAAFSVVELQGAGECFKDAVGHAVHVAAFQACVVGDADSSENSCLFTTQSGYASASVGDQSGLLGCDPGTARGEELLDLLLGFHET